jgi:hypothetical protein
MKTCLIVTTALVLVLPRASASPTSSDFVSCHQLASAKALSCLNRQPGARPAATQRCWTEASNANTACYAAVRASHARPDPARVAAEKKAREGASAPGAVNQAVQQR